MRWPALLPLDEPSEALPPAHEEPALDEVA